MIPLTCLKSKKIFVFGLGSSGMATAKALRAGGAVPLVWDDASEKVETAYAEGLTPYDLKRAPWPPLDALVLAPGIPLNLPKPHWCVTEAQKRGVPVIGDLTLFMRQRAYLGLAPPSEASFDLEDLLACYAPVFAITGTNGKSTTTAWLTYTLQQMGYDAVMGGNIGVPVCALPPLVAGRIYVLECSSYQLELTPSFQSDFAIHLNLTPDHLERHGSFAQYAKIKTSLLLSARNALIGLDDVPSQAMAAQVGAAGKSLMCFSTQEAPRPPHTAQMVFLTQGDRIVCQSSETKKDICVLTEETCMVGVHNRQNGVAIAAALSAAGIPPSEINAALPRFKGLAHRQEYLGVHNGIIYINDSKATNAQATQQALARFERIYWIAGGIAKDGGIESLEPYFPKIIKTYLFGRDAPLLAKTLEGKSPFALCDTLAKALECARADALRDLRRAKKSAHSPPVILFSPSCASFDQFQNFEERGDFFRQCVLERHQIG